MQQGAIMTSERENTFIPTQKPADKDSDKSIKAREQREAQQRLAKQWSQS
tara:strand:+ start:686 stop:835 length:150 start_codon:yes stop_codon:yes gene_type:complete